jgi:hypothetical protein
MKFPPLYLPVFLVVSLVALFSLWSGAPGTRSRCDKTVACADSARTNYDWTFLCCEDETFWPGSHVVAPIGIYILIGDEATAAFLVVFWEVIETLSLVIAGQYVLYPTTPGQLETSAGQLLGDGFINGFYGILLGMLVSSYSGYPGLLHLIRERRGGATVFHADQVRKRVIWKYTGIFVLYCLCFLIAGHHVPSFVYGPYICLAMLAIFLFVCARYLIKEDDVPGVNMRKTFRRAALPWFIVSVVTSIGALGSRILANEWYQVWVFYYASTLIMLAYARICSKKKCAQ